MHFIVLVSAGGTTAEQVRGKSLLGVEDSDTVMQSRCCKGPGPACPLSGAGDAPHLLSALEGAGPCRPLFPRLRQLASSWDWPWGGTAGRLEGRWKGASRVFLTLPLHLGWLLALQL